MIKVEVVIFTPRTVLGARRFKKMPWIGHRFKWRGQKWLVSGAAAVYPGPTNATVFVVEERA
jgi:hypothetical protein